MSWKQGLVECYPLGPNCFLDWGAITTGLAVIVALGVGLAPIVRDHFHRERHALMAAKILAGELSLLEHRLLVASEVGLKCQNLVDHWQHKEMKMLLMQVTADSANRMVPHVRNMPRDIEDQLAECIGLLSAFERAVSNREETLPYETVKVADWREHWIYLARELSTFRYALCQWSGAKNEDPADSVPEGVRQVMDRASDNKVRFQAHNPPSSVQEMQPS